MKIEAVETILLRIPYTCGGSTDTDFEGACCVKTIKMNGNFNFHFDENLKKVLPAEKLREVRQSLIKTPDFSRGRSLRAPKNNTIWISSL